MELDNKIYDKITKLTDEGNEMVEREDFLSAINKYKSALELIPNPKEIWEATTWIYTALGDSYFLIESYEESLNCLFKTLNCPGGLDNPFIMLRIGQCFFEMNNIVKAKEYLLRAYMCEGVDIFEDEDEKYLNLLKSVL